MSFKINQPRKKSMAEMIEHQRIERGVEPIPLEADLLLKRIADGGHSGEFLADAFASAYRMTPFNHSLGELLKLDDEGFRLFHQILHIRHVSGWNDDQLYLVEQHIKQLSSSIPISIINSIF
jgi:hypothetical protein